MSMTIPGYTLEEKAGRGAYGDVWLARDRAGRRVAVKIIDRTEAADKELVGLRNYAALADFSHLIRVFHIGELPNAFYYTMEPADSLDAAHYQPATLGNLLRAGRRFPAMEVLQAGGELADALDELHRAGLIHRDVKPENILFVDRRIKLSDVGLLRAATPSVSLAGTLGFIPPERLLASSGSQTAEDDLYGLGKALYCMWTGNPPERFPEIPAALLAEPGAARLNSILNTACSRHPGRRFATADELARALRDNSPPRRGRRFLAAVGGGALAALLVAAGVAWFGPRRDARAKSALTAKDFPETLDIRLPGNVKMRMIKVLPGEFRMGRDIGNEERTVRLTAPFWIGETEVTQRQWLTLFRNNPSDPVMANAPVNFITFYNAKDFCDQLNRNCADQLPPGFRFDLPSEAQWEYAARGGHRMVRYSLYSGSDRASEVAWFRSEASTIMPVAKKKPNELGLYDMSGNLWEWTRTYWYTPSLAPEVDPEGPKTGKYVVFRGGAWDNYGNRELLTLRNWQWPPGKGEYSTGFRVAIVKTPPAK